MTNVPSKRIAENLVHLSIRTMKSQVSALAMIPALAVGMAVTAMSAPSLASEAIPYAVGESVTIKNNAGQNLHALVFKAEETKALMVALHGMQSHSGWFMSGPELAENGITTVAFDRRGSGLSEGLRGHADSAEDFLVDLKAAVDYAKALAPGKPIHLHANCFGVRTAIPYLSYWDRRGDIKSIIMTSPGTSMSPAADFTLSEKLCIKWIIMGFASDNCQALMANEDYVLSPLKDELFVSRGPWLEQFVKTDKLAVRMLTPEFLLATNALSTWMNAALTDGSFKTPMLVVLGDGDKMVLNNKIINELVKPHKGKKQVLQLPCEHGFEFCDANSVQKYRDTMVNWLLQGS